MKDLDAAVLEGLLAALIAATIVAVFAAFCEAWG